MKLYNPCPRGEHDLAREENVYEHRGRQLCRPCRAARSREYRARKKAGIASDPFHPMSAESRFWREGRNEALW